MQAPVNLLGHKSFKHRLLILIVALIGVAQAATILLALSYVHRSVERSAEHELHAAQTVLLRQLESRQQRLLATADVLVSDFAFKAAVASNDSTTIQSALANHAERIGAAVAILYGRDGQLIASTARLPAALTQPLAQGPLANPDDAGLLLCAFNGGAMQFALAPLRAPEPIAWVAFGFALDSDVAHQLASLVDLNVAFVTRTDADTTPVSAATDSSGVLHTDAQALSLTMPLPMRAGHLELSVSFPVERMMASYRKARDALLLIAGAALLGAIVIALVAGRSAARPVELLAQAARRIEAGDYDQPVQLRGVREFEHLAQTFNGMQIGLREREERIRFQALHDALTELPNRLGLREQLSQWLAHGAPATLLLLDLHRFRDINASLDRSMADQVLRAVADRLRGAAGAEGGAARFGADQFGLLLRTDDAAVAERTVAAFAAELRNGLQVGELRVTLIVRAGISSTATSARDADNLMRQADFALLEAKERGITSVRYQAAHDAEHQRGVMLVAELRRAIAHNELTLAFQPIVRVTNGELSHFEALVRWTHATLGVISPGEFIPLAERASAIGELTHWLIGAVLVQLRHWREIGYRGCVAVNLSAGDVTDPELPPFVLRQLTESGIDGDQLLFEVTESAIMREQQAAVRIMQELRAMGIRFAVDDFGTGHSSLAQLHALPVDELKIDGSFVRELGRAERSLVIVRSTTELGHGLGLTVVAEGVETPEAWSALLRLGCDYAQGYLISRPMPAHDVPGWLQGRRNQLAEAVSRAADSGELVDLNSRRANLD